MLPFSTSIFHIINEKRTNSEIYQNIDSKFILEKKDDCNLIVQCPSATVNSKVTDSFGQSCSNLPISTRKDRFKNRNEYRVMYSYRGLIDNKHYLSIKRILKTINRWDFNIFALERFSSGYPLTYLSINLFEVHILINHFKLDVSKLYQFFITIERSYHPSNPYHNALHAADVTQAINCIIRDQKIWKHLSKQDVLCSLLSSICHDVDHPGLNNTFMNNSQHHLSMLYKKESVLENHHWAFSLSVLMETKLFSHFDSVLWKSITDTCCNLIRATDISKQNSYIDDFNKTILSISPTREGYLRKEETLLVLQMAIKCADICNPCRRWDICNCWAYLVTEEFFQQGDKEKLMSLPVSPIMDREKIKLAVVQKDFINYLVLPLFRVWDQFMKSETSRTFLSHIDSNQTMWQQLVDKPIVESDSIILQSIQSLYDRLQLMQVMDYTKDHQLSHLQRLHWLLDVDNFETRPQCNEVDDNQNQDPLSDLIEVGHTKLYHQCRRGSLPLMPSNRNSMITNNPNRQRLMSRRTSLQPGQGFVTTLTSTSTATRLGQFPTASRRRSAPAIKVNQVYPLFVRSTSHCQFYRPRHANSLNDVQIPQVR